MTIQSHGTNDVDRPAHAHVNGDEGNKDCRIGPDGKPRAGQRALTKKEAAAVAANVPAIKKELRKVGRSAGGGGQLARRRKHEQEEVMIELLARLSQPDLEAIYTDAPGAAARLGIQPANPEDWERWRKYAYSKHRENRLSENRPLSAEEVEEWRAFVQLDFLNNEASSVIGDAARRNLLSEDALRTLPGTPGLTPYASRQLQARSALSRLAVGPALVDELLDLRAHWALHELLSRPPGEGEIAVLAAAAQDPRLSRTERHHLREALRKRGR